MESIKILTEINLMSWCILGFMILSAFIAMYEIIGKFSSIIGKPVKWVRIKNDDHELLIQTINNVSELQKRHVEDMEKLNDRDVEMRKDIKKLTDMFIDKNIDDMRWEINDFASRVSNGSRCNKDSYVHCIKVYEKYEKLLREYNLQNGEVEISIEVIKDSYAQKLKDGF